jgi:hypothetical protein
MSQSTAGTGMSLLDQSLSASSDLSPWEFSWICNPPSQTSEESLQHTSLSLGIFHHAFAILLVSNNNA